ILMVTAARQQFPAGTEAQLNSAEAEFNATIAAFNNGASATDRQMYLDTVAGPDVDDRARLLQSIQVRADRHASNIGVAPTDVQNAGDGAAGLLHAAEQNMNSELRSEV